MLDFLPPRGKRFYTQEGRATGPHTQSCPRRSFDQRLGRSSLSPLYPKFLGWCLETLDCCRTPRPPQGSWYRTIAEVDGHRPCSLSLFRFQRGCLAFILAFDRCASILRLLTGDSTTVVDRRRRGVNPTPNSHTGGWWLDETSPTCLSKWSETIAA